MEQGFINGRRGRWEWFLMTINFLAQKIRKFNFRDVKRRVAGYKEYHEEKMNNTKLRIIRRLRKFSQPEKSSGIFCSSKTEHLQQNKTKNCKKLS